MDRLTVFEQSLAAELHEMAGAGRRIDALAMVQSVSNPSQWWRFQPMFNAAKLVLAGAILAVVGGFLVSTVSAPKPDRDPAQVGASPSPTTSSLPSSPASSESPASGLVTEDVEPGVVRIIRDGAGHDLDKGHPSNRFDTDGISIGGDGTVWVNSTYHGSDNQAHPQQGPLVWALGRPGVFGVKDGVPGSAFNDVVATADGSALLFGGGRVVEFDGSRFVGAGSTSYPLVGGTLWVFSPSQLAANASPPVNSPTEEIVVIKAGDHWTSLAEWTKLVDVNGSFCMATSNGVSCGGDRFGSGRTYLSGTNINQIASAPDGSLWAVTGSDAGGGLYRITLP